MSAAVLEFDPPEDRASQETASGRQDSKAPPDKEPERVVTLLRGDEIKPEAVRWIWPGWLARGKLHVLAGAPGTGKSTIAFRIAAAITTGGYWPDGTRAPVGDVLIWSGEDDPADTIAPRLIAAGANMKRVHIVSSTLVDGQSRPFDPAADMDALRQSAASIGDVTLLIADPIVSAVAGDSYKNTEVRRDLQPLVYLGALLGCAVLGISHFTKGTTGRDPVERVTGSIAFAALARIVLATAKPEEGPRVLARAKSNIGPDGDGFEYTIGMVEIGKGMEASRVDWGAGVTGPARELLGSAEEAGDPEKGHDVTEWLREMLNAVTPAKDVQAAAKECGFTPKQLRTAREKLGVVVRKGTGEGQTAPWYWSLPEPDKVPSPSQDAQDAQPQSVGTLGTLPDSGVPAVDSDEWADLP